MKTIVIIAMALVTLNCVAQEDISTTKEGPQGGLLQVVQNFNIELVNSINYVSVYLYDKTMNPVSNDGVLSDITFCYPYDECLFKRLSIVGKNGYSVSLANSHFIYCEINLIVNGQPLHARFMNTSGLAESK